MTVSRLLCANFRPWVCKWRFKPWVKIKPLVNSGLWGQDNSVGMLTNHQTCSKLPWIIQISCFTWDKINRIDGLGLEYFSWKKNLLEQFFLWRFHYKNENWEGFWTKAMHFFCVCGKHLHFKMWISASFPKMEQYLWVINPLSIPRIDDTSIYGQVENKN